MNVLPRMLACCRYCTYGFSAFIAALVLVSSCDTGNLNPPGQFEAIVNPDLQPEQPVVPTAQGVPQTVARTVDAQGIQSDFIEGLIVFRPESLDDLTTFLDRYDGTILSDDTIPEPPASLGITLTAEQRQPTEYVISINLSTADVVGLPENAEAAGLTGLLEFSTEDGLRTIAAIADAVVIGFDASPEYLSYPSQAFPTTLFSTQERPNNPPPGFTDAFNVARYQTTGSQSNVTLAWQFLAAHGISRRVRVAIVDGGYWLNPNGTPRGTDSDFPANPVQYDFVQNDYFADGPGVTGCGAGNPCFWHGTGATGVATGILNNSQGAGGTGGQIGDPILLATTGLRSNNNWAIRTAIAWGADVVSMSWGGDCNTGCRIYDRDHTPFDDAVGAGSRAVFVAAAGNGRGNPAAGYDVGDPSFVHPCIEDHVLCVGALNDNGTTKIGYSNFGAQVGVFAPTNIPVMSQPASTDNNPAGPAAPRSFGGTSASTPFVAGVAAMMKAINPDLTGDQVAQIIRDTAHVGTAPVSRFIDAYAAVRRAAEGIDGVKDRHENNDLETTPKDLGNAATYTEANLNLHRSADRDHFKFVAASGSTMTVDLQYPEALSALSLVNLQSLGECGTPAFVSDTGLANSRGHRFVYQVPGGPLQVGVRGDDINAYNLNVSFAGATFTPDDYEPNDSDATAHRLYSTRSVFSGNLSYLTNNYKATIDASIHNATDFDWYVVRGVTLTLADRVFFNAYPALKVYGNESPISMEIYTRQEDGSRGPLVGAFSGGSCTAKPVTAQLIAGQYYYVLIYGTPGRYTLQNGMDGEARRFPALVRDRVYEVLNPGEPVIRSLRYRTSYVFAASRAFSEVRSAGTRLRMNLYDFDGVEVAKSVAGAGGQRLSLASTLADQVYTLQIARADADADPPVLSLQWEAVETEEETGNLILNPGAEIVGGGDPDGFENWDLVAGLDAPQIYFYDDQDDTTPSPTGPGPEGRGLHLFAGGVNKVHSGIRQTVPINDAWEAAIDQGTVRARFSAFLGGRLDEADSAEVKLTFADTDGGQYGELRLAPVTPLDREGETGLFPVSVEDMVPVGTQVIIIDLTFNGLEGSFNDGYADNLELILSNFAP